MQLAILILASIMLLSEVIDIFTEGKSNLLIECIVVLECKSTNSNMYHSRKCIVLGDICCKEISMTKQQVQRVLLPVILMMILGFGLMIGCAHNKIKKINDERNEEERGVATVVLVSQRGPCKLYEVWYDNTSYPVWWTICENENYSSGVASH